MKKIVFAIVTVLLLTLAVENVFAQGKGRGKAQTNKKLEQKKQEKAKQNIQDNKAKTEDTAKDVKEQTKGQLKKESQEAADKAGVKKKSEDAKKAPAEAHKRQLAAIKEHIGRQKEKHLRRQAKLERIIELARKKGKDELAEKAQQLKQKEQQRYEFMTKRMEARKQKVMQLRKTDAGSNNVNISEQSPAKERAEAEERIKEKLQAQHRIKTEDKDKTEEKEQDKSQEDSEED